MKLFGLLIMGRVGEYWYKFYAYHLGDFLISHTHTHTPWVKIAINFE